MNRYEGAVCPACGQAFTQADDIVVCPSCGTPHHRACWMREGHCANEEKHAQGYTWQEAPRQQEDFQEKTELGVICPRCGTNSPKDTLFCPHCGQPLGAQPAQGQAFFGGQYPPFGAQSGGPIEGVPADETIDGIPVAEVAAYVRTGTRSYIPKFFRMDRSKKKAGWNWAAFLFSPFWFFYRKLYAAGAVVLSLLMALSVAFYGPLEAYVNAYLQWGEVILQQPSNQAVIDAAMQSLQSAMPLAAVFLLLQLVLHVVCALVANRLYFKKAMGDLHALREQTLEESEYQMQIFRKGGTSLLFGFSSYLLYDLAYMLIIQLLAMFS